MAARIPHSGTSEEIRAMMSRMGLDSLPPIMADKKPAGTLCTTSQKIITNIHGLKVPDGLQVYRYDVTIQAVKEQRDGTEKVIDLTKKARSDAIVTNRKDLCRSVFQAAVEEHPDIFGPINQMCYDLQSTLFTPKVITEDTDGVTYDVANEYIARQLPGARAQIKIKPVKDVRVLDASELNRITSHLEEVDHSLQQYLELETSQTALMNQGDHITYPGGKSFLMNPGNFGFTARDTPELGIGKFLGIGCQKSIRYIEGPKGPGNKRVGVVIDTKKTPFHSCLPMVEIAGGVIHLANRVLTNNEIDHLKTTFIGLSAQTRHETPPRTITIHSISNENAQTKTIELPEGDGTRVVTVEQYFRERYDIPLNFPLVNLVIESGPQKSEFPMELLQIADNQRVRTEHQTPELVQNMIRACAVPPSTLIPQNLRNGEALGLYGAHKSEQLTAMNIDVMPTPVTVKTRVLPPPYIQYGNNITAAPEPARATWSQRAHYLVPCDLGKWAIYILGSMPPRHRSRFEQNELQQFLSCFQQQCTRVGVQYVAPSYMSSVPIDVGRVEEEFKACRADGYTFMFFIHADNDQSMHKVVKMLERQYEMVTQLVKMQNAADIINKGKQQTMENILHKTNIKLGGVNYELRLSSDAKVTVIVPNRMHNLRFMLENANPQMRAPDQNVRPGTVVDTVVVHPSFNEFYLNPHVALQGTAKTPRFTVLYDQNKLSMDATELLCYTLCFGHQIVRLPTSLPSPVYIATRYAERGRALLNASATLIELVEGQDPFEQLQAHLPYFLSDFLRDRRVNA